MVSCPAWPHQNRNPKGIPCAVGTPAVQHPNVQSLRKRNFFSQTPPPRRDGPASQHGLGLGLGLGLKNGKKKGSFLAIFDSFSKIFCRCVPKIFAGLQKFIGTNSHWQLPHRECGGHEHGLCAFLGIRGLNRGELQLGAIFGRAKNTRCWSFP